MLYVIIEPKAFKINHYKIKIKITSQLYQINS